MARRREGNLPLLRIFRIRFPGLSAAGSSGEEIRGADCRASGGPGQVDDRQEFQTGPAAEEWEAKQGENEMPRPVTVGHLSHISYINYCFTEQS